MTYFDFNTIAIVSETTFHLISAGVFIMGLAIMNKYLSVNQLSVGIVAAAIAMGTSLTWVAKYYNVVPDDVITPIWILFVVGLVMIVYNSFKEVRSNG